MRCRCEPSGPLPTNTTVAVQFIMDIESSEGVNCCDQLFLYSRETDDCKSDNWTRVNDLKTFNVSPGDSAAATDHTVIVRAELTHFCDIVVAFARGCATFVVSSMGLKCPPVVGNLTDRHLGISCIEERVLTLTKANGIRGGLGGNAFGVALEGIGGNHDTTRLYESATHTGTPLFISVNRYDDGDCNNIQPRPSYPYQPLPSKEEHRVYIFTVTQLGDISYIQIEFETKLQPKQTVIIFQHLFTGGVKPHKLYKVAESGKLGIASLVYKIANDALNIPATEAVVVPWSTLQVPSNASSPVVGMSSLSIASTSTSTSAATATAATTTAAVSTAGQSSVSTT
jgi:hypothetical protein